MIGNQDLQQLLERDEEDCVSLYMPTIKAGPETRQNPIRFKNLLRDAQSQLAELGRDEQKRNALLAQAANLLEDRGFWQHAEHGLAIFLADGLFRVYRLPASFEELAVVNQRFHLKPLLPLVTDRRRYYVLALSQNDVRLLACGPWSAQIVDLGDTPTSLAEALGHQLTEQQLQFHSSGAPGSPQYHAQGGGKDDVKPEIRKFFSWVDDGVVARLGTDHRPLILAGVDYLLALYREHSRYTPILDEGLSGNPEQLSVEELHDKTWPLAKAYFAQARTAASERFHQRLGEGRASSDLQEVIPAAVDGRIESLFVVGERQCWGDYDAERRQLSLHEQRQANSEDLLDLAALQTYLQGGEVFVCTRDQVPGDEWLAATFRY